MQRSQPKHIEVHGHRGARARFPENSLPAFAYAIELGVDAIELDVVVTSDLHLVVTHDEIVNPAICRRIDGMAMDGDFVIYQHRREELAAFECGGQTNPRFPHQKKLTQTHIPDLAEVFDLARQSPHAAARKLRFIIEMKTIPGRRHESPEPLQFAQLLVAEIKRYDLSDRVLVQSFDHTVLWHVKDLAPSIMTSALVHQCHPDLLAVARSARADAVSPHHEWITIEDVKALHQAHVRVIAWTVNEVSDWQRMLDLGVDGIICDDPEALLLFLKQRGKR